MLGAEDHEEGCEFLHRFRRGMGLKFDFFDWGSEIFRRNFSNFIEKIILKCTYFL